MTKGHAILLKKTERNERRKCKEKEKPRENCIIWRSQETNKTKDGS